MLNPIPEIMAALSSDVALTAKIGTGVSEVGKVFNAYPSIEVAEPYVIFEEDNNKPAFGADDAEKASEITIAITAVAANKTVLAAILLDVDRIMVCLGYIRDSTGPVLPIDQNFCKLIRFKIEMEVL
jgi:hypothetical protein